MPTTLLLAHPDLKIQRHLWNLTIFWRFKSYFIQFFVKTSCCKGNSQFANKESIFNTNWIRIKLLLFLTTFGSISHDDVKKKLPSLILYTKGKPALSCFCLLLILWKLELAVHDSKINVTIPRVLSWFESVFVTQGWLLDQMDVSYCLRL